MLNKGFKEEDVKKMTEAINFITRNMILKSEKVDVIEAQQLIAHIANLQTILKLVSDNVVEIKRILDTNKNASKEAR